MSCSCAELMIGNDRTGSKNWNPDCSVHGIESEWYRSDEQVAKREAENDRTRRSQTLAAIARRLGTGHPSTHNDALAPVGKCPLCDAYRQQEAGR